MKIRQVTHLQAILLYPPYLFGPAWYLFVLPVILVITLIILIFLFRIKPLKAKSRELEKTVEKKTAETKERNRQFAKQKKMIGEQTEKLRDANDNLASLSEIGRIITSHHNIEKIIDAVYESINKVMDAAVFGIGILNEKNNSIDFPGVKEKGETLEFLSFSLNDELRLSAYCCKTGKAVFINDFDREYNKYLPAITPPGKSGNSSSILYTPLIQGDKVMGVITVQSFKKNAYSQYHLNFLKNMAVYTTAALENAPAYR